MQINTKGVFANAISRLQWTRNTKNLHRTDFAIFSKVFPKFGHWSRNEIFIDIAFVVENTLYYHVLVFMDIKTLTKHKTFFS